MKRASDIQEKNPFKVPENYFEEVNRKIISATAGTETVNPKTGLYRRLKPYLAVAASIAAFIILSYTISKISHQGIRNLEIPDISMQEFSESYLHEIDLRTLEEKIESPVPYEEVPDVSNAQIIEYLLLVNIDENEIYELF